MGPDKAVIEAVYVQLKLARDTLVDPAKRSAYDRFGPEILQWKQCKTIGDFVLTGVQRTTMYYFASGVGLVLLSVLGYLQQGKFWRYFVLGSMFVIELHTMMEASFPALLQLLNPVLQATGIRSAYLPIHYLALLRKLAITLFVAFSQLGPLLQAQRGMDEGNSTIVQQLDRMDALAKATDQEATRLMGLEMMPFVGERSRLQDLRASLREWLVQNTIRNDPEVKNAINSVLSQRRSELPDPRAAELG